MDERRIADWYQKYSTEIYRFCLTLLADRASTEDALQETFLKALRSPGKKFSQRTGEKLALSDSETHLLRYAAKTETGNAPGDGGGISVPHSGKRSGASSGFCGYGKQSCEGG